MERLVYSPLVQAYVKTDAGVIDVSPYIVSGSVNRKINQVSSAQLTLRNTKDSSGSMVFTEAKRSDGTRGALVHPMDPIVILMQRLQGHKLQVFTGYVDKSPYLALYPGVVTIEASCTLKRLLYTQWDAALPFVQYFLAQFGWVPMDTQGTMYNPSAEAKTIAIQEGKVVSGAGGSFTDSSLGALLFAVLTQIGYWDPQNIFIEGLPSTLPDIINSIYTRTSQEAQDGTNTVASLLQQILGSTSQGSGSASASASPGGSTVVGSGSFQNGGKGLTIKGAPITAAQLANLNTALSVAASLHANTHVMEAMVFAGIAEESWNADHSPGNAGHHGVFQSTSFSDTDVAGAARAWLTGGPSFGHGGGIAYEKANPTASLELIAEAVELGGSYTGESNYNLFAPESKAIVAAWAAGGSSSATTTSNTNRSGTAKHGGTFG